jgi:transposase
VARIDSWLAEDKTRPRKQRHTAKKIFERLRDECRFDGGYTIVKDYVRTQKRGSREMFVPLSHPPGHGQADFGEALVVIGGIEQKAYFFAFDLPHSDACYIRAYPAANTEAWLDGHVHAFAFFGAVPRSVLYDNDRCLVAKIMPDGTRNRTQRFSAMLSHYVIGDRYGRPGKGNDKGKVEGLVGYGRRNFMVPIPRFADWNAFNDYLEEQCCKRQSDILRGHKISIGERLGADLAAMRPLPAAPFEACDLQSGQVTSTSQVRYRGNDYSVPVAYGHREVWVKGFVTRVVIGCAAEIIATHPRSYDMGDMMFDPVHYLPLIERKIMSFDQAAPLQGWELPEAFKTLQRLLEARQGKTGKREYVQVLRLLERFDLAVLHLAIKDALQMRAVSFDAIKHLLLCRVERRPPRLDLDVYPFLPRTNVATTSAATYMSLLAGDEV